MVNPKINTPMHANANFAGVSKVHAWKNKITHVSAPLVVANPPINISIPPLQKVFGFGLGSGTHCHLHVGSIGSGWSLKNHEISLLFNLAVHKNIFATIGYNRLYLSLKSVFSEIRARTWVQVVSCQKTASDRLTYLVNQLEACFCGGKPLELLSWLLNRISEKNWL